MHVKTRLGFSGSVSGQPEEIGQVDSSRHCPSGSVAAELDSGSKHF